MFLAARPQLVEFSRSTSEPDIVVVGDNEFVIIEAKLTASNNTTPTNLEVENNYTAGGGRWFAQVFTEDFQTIAVDAKKYELLRFWLLGTWLANELGMPFHLLNLVRGECEKDIEGRFGLFIRQHSKARFSRGSWEDIWRFIQESGPKTPETTIVLDYFSNRTTGYSNGFLKRAFNLAS